MAGLKPGITVIVPTIPPREKQLQRAIASVQAQTFQPYDVVVEMDRDHRGAAITRDAALAHVGTEWTAVLDDDDEFLPWHLEKLFITAVTQNASYVYSFPEMPVPGTTNPLERFNGVPWDSTHPHQTTVVALYKTDLAREIGGYSGGWVDQACTDELGNRIGEDAHFTMKFNEVGKIVHHPEATWRWYHWGFGTPGNLGNTAGLPERWS